MSDNRPYDPNQLANLTEHISHHGTVLATPPEASIIHDPNFEHHQGFFRGATVAIGGLFKAFTDEGVAERAANAQKRLDVISHVGNRIANPRTTDNPAEKIGWVGTHKRDLGTRRRPEEHVNLGTQLMDYKSLGEPPTPNPNRPTTRSERSADRRMEAKREKLVKARNMSRWLGGSDAEVLSRGHHRLSFTERRNARGNSRRSAKLERIASRAETKFNKIASSDDIRGRLVARRARTLNDKVASRKSLRRAQQINHAYDNPQIESTPARTTFQAEPRHAVRAKAAGAQTVWHSRMANRAGRQSDAIIADWQPGDNAALHNLELTKKKQKQHKRKANQARLRQLRLKHRKETQDVTGWM